MEGPHIMGKQGMPVGDTMPTEMREKMWDELTDSEKIERMHDVVRSLQSLIDRLQEEVDRLERHEHGELGRLLVPFAMYGYDVSPGGDKDRWF